jgi:hypothetical protein
MLECPPPLLLRSFRLIRKVIGSRRLLFKELITPISLLAAGNGFGIKNFYLHARIYERERARPRRAVRSNRTSHADP